MEINNLNLRSVVADAEGGSILERTLQSIVRLPLKSGVLNPC
ncbi:hypothetical protein [Variovorax gossypii]